MVSGDSFIVFWNDIIHKMAYNYEKIHYKEVYEYLKNIDLKKAKKERYLITIKEIIKR